MAEPRTIAVLKGGWSSEREVSLISGAACAQALREAGYAVREIDVTRDPARLLAALDPAPDVVFNALHGTGGEDGTIQGVLEMLRVPYTHSGVRASALAMHKQAAKHVLAAAGIRVPEGQCLPRDRVVGRHPIVPPYVGKPVDQGSSVGIHIIRHDTDAPVSDADVGTLPDALLVERYVPGRELTVAVMGAEGAEPTALAVTEIVPRQGFYDYRAKYTDGVAAHVLPADLPPRITALCLDWAARAHRVLDCGGVSRTDFRFDDSRPGTDGLYVLETNTQPGMTPLSLVPEQAAHTGMDFTALCRWIVEAARCPA